MARIILDYSHHDSGEMCKIKLVSSTWVYFDQILSVTSISSLSLLTSEAYSEPCETSKIEFVVKKDFQQKASSYIFDWVLNMLLDITVDKHIFKAKKGIT